MSKTRESTSRIASDWLVAVEKTNIAMREMFVFMNPIDGVPPCRSSS